MQKTLIFYVQFTKKLFFFSLFTPHFLFEISIISEHNSLKQTYIEGGGGRGGGGCTYKTNRNEPAGGGGSKTGSFEQTYFLNAIKVEGNLPVKKNVILASSLVLIKKYVNLQCFFQ